MAKVNGKLKDQDPGDVVLTLGGERPPRFVEVDGERYRLRYFEELSLVEAGRVERAARSVAAMMAKDAPTEAEVAAVDGTMIAVLRTILEGLPAEVAAAVGDMDKQRVVTFFFQTAPAWTRQKIPTTTSPRDSNASTGATPPVG